MVWSWPARKFSSWVCVDSIGSFRGGGVSLELSLQRGQQDLADERGLAGTTDAGERHEAAERNFEGEILQVVARGVGEDERTRSFGVR